MIGDELPPSSTITLSGGINFQAQTGITQINYGFPNHSASVELQQKLPDVISAAPYSEHVCLSMYGLLQELVRLRSEVEELKDQLRYAPGGPVFQAAEQDFESRQASEDYCQK
eukprot:gnl/Hemi2/16402_TR5472_c0_g1_i1.p1 gnl/Hemi2/16402_TR5472_c0_g1~~gnl/Hemi2/16402_TR5472_c0_g1_i1.p1  ORF type:complete len:113 (+),score=17.54 gnl/Hemi2/16402_TR5472_c0_g1_i1:58-396(+)